MKIGNHSRAVGFLSRKNKVETSFILICSVFAFLFSLIFVFFPVSIYAQSVDDPNLVVEPYTEGLVNATSMAFLDSENMLVLERGGTVRLVSNGQLVEQPILKVPVNSTHVERGLLGIAVLDNTKGNKSEISTFDQGQENNNLSVLLYFTEPVISGISYSETGTQLNDTLRNRVYKYDWNNFTKTLENPTLIVDLQALPGPNHNAGKLMIGPDNLLYGMIGDLLTHKGQLQNFKDGPPPDDTSIIYRVNASDGSIPTTGNPFSTDPSNPLSKYYAYGIRNSFGITYDPITGNVWTSENGEAKYDEINLVKPGFNGGWKSVTGPISNSTNTEDDLFRIEGSYYSDPILSWFRPIGITDLEFLNSSTLGERYSNNLFAGDYNKGNLYYFELTPNRTALALPNIPDRVVDTEEEQSSIVFGDGFIHITDLETGPEDGYLYILTYNGIIYRVLPA
ncbi:PQQ-dependent sugar dehydrogenase [Candidatus Nitrosocosmicus franklandus]|uniref:Soluble aldose sugar dehydrogenase YliI n=1 Tax=Candidatus Nitrosocosmicus franklandianus TaxID=1798806 RepID=A0A484I5P3_9ARCH|nr:PQQ-dependent sugar dehydrogenase [Candidatus Nitrosocosmicus franklandus]VFJ12508.1 Soluble aldose sugar dehydrogenase YliI [Candidatus Nitrosocosmicus franklandus]